MLRRSFLKMCAASAAAAVGAIVAPKIIEEITKVEAVPIDEDVLAELQPQLQTWSYTPQTYTPPTYIPSTVHWHDGGTSYPALDATQYNYPVVTSGYIDLYSSGKSYITTGPNGFNLSGSKKIIAHQWSNCCAPKEA